MVAFVAFSDLPGEVILLIADQLTSERDISSLARTSSAVYSLVNPYLYRLQTHEPYPSALYFAVLYDRAGTAERFFAAAAEPCLPFGAAFDFQQLFDTAAYFGCVEVTELLLRMEGVDSEVQAGTQDVV